MKTLYIVDALNFLFRAYYAIGSMSNPKGESTGALYGFIRSIYKLITDFSPDYFIAVFDGPDNKKSRTAIYSEYKSHRAKMPDDLFPQLEKALYFCEIAGIPHLSISGVEADDVIGSIAKWAETQSIEVRLCSSDKDLCQLITDSIKIINPQKGNLLIDRKKTQELFGVTPEQIIDLLALMGDASDNIPGLEGIGPKTAVALLNEFGTLEEILANPDKISGKKKEVILQGKEIARISQQLATIHTGVDFPKKLEFFHLKTPDIEKAKAFYTDAHFLSLLKELSTEEKKSKTSTYTTVDDEESLDALLSLLKKEKELCIDTETTDVRPMRAALVGIGIAITPEEIWYIPTNGRLGKKRILSALKPLLENPAISFIGHNIKYDLHVLCNEGIHLANIAFDTMLASYLLSPHIQKHNLDALSLEKFGKVKIPIDALLGKGKALITMDLVPIERVSEYCCEDVEYTLRLKHLFKKELEKVNLTHLFSQVEIPLIPILMHMEREGIYVDIEKLKIMSASLAKKLHQLEKHIYEIAGEEFNINSPKQLSLILFEKLQIKSPKKTTTGYSTAADVLESLQDESPIIKKIIEYRTLEKLRSTYVDSLPDEILPSTQRIHCTFNQSVAATGRLSCQNPNLQNIPVRTEEGKKIREAFKPESPQSNFLSADYSQIELRLLAHLSNDPALIQAFLAGEDIHAYTASQVFDVPLKDVTPEMRHQSKAVNFGILYGQQAYGLSQQLGIDHKSASRFIETYFERYPKVKEFLTFCKEEARRTGHSITLTGRLRPIPEIHNKNPFIRAQAERLAVNTPLQGTAADLIKMAMIQVDAYLKKHPHLGKMILQIHDELIFEVQDDAVHQLSSHVKEIMETTIALNVPLIVDISIGKNWGEC